jgi:hypothetical protein
MVKGFAIGVLMWGLACETGAGTTLEDVTLWDYRGTSPSKVSLPAYHGWLLSWCRGTPPPRLVLYVSSPCLDTEFGTFYDPSATPSSDANPASLVDFLADLHAACPGVEVELLLDRSSFPASGASAPCWSGGSATTHPSLNLSSEWINTPLAMDWLGALIENPHVPSGVLAGVTFDPEVSGGNVPGSSCVPAGSHGVSMSYQQLADWVDAWKQANGHTTLRLGMTFEVDSANMARLNIATFPLEASLQSVLSAASPELNCQLNGSGYPSWRDGDAGPILQSCYLQVYVVCAENAQGVIEQASSFWRWQTEDGCEQAASPTPRSPSDAAASLVLNMTQQAGSPGPGTLEVAADVTLTGVGTRFLDWAPYTRVTATQPDGTVLPTSGEWKIDTMTSNTAASGYGSSDTTQGADLPYHYSELLMNWLYPYVDADMAARVWPMFSINATTLAPFFGYWTEQDFLAFLDAFEGAADGATIARSVYSSDGTTGVPLPANWAMYDLQLACDQWGIGTYPTQASHVLPCAANFSGSETIDVHDLLLLLQDWGDSSADLNGDGTTGDADLRILLSVWGSRC